MSPLLPANPSEAPRIRVIQRQSVKYQNLEGSPSMQSFVVHTLLGGGVGTGPRIHCHSPSPWAVFFFPLGMTRIPISGLGAFG